MTSSDDRQAWDAADWDARLRSPFCTPDDRDEFAAWCAASQANRDEVEKLHASLSALKDAAAMDPTLRAIVDRAGAKVHAQTTRRRLFGAGAIAASLTIMAGAYLLAQQFTGPTSANYATRAGERATIRLEDGSTVTLNSQTELRVKYTSSMRALSLPSGEALFDVAKGKRPFVVTVDDRQVVAHGTSFNIRNDARRFQLTMVEGKVSVRSAVDARARPQEVPLVAGERMIVDRGDKNLQITRADVARDTSWTSGKVQFENEPLSSALEEMNRYRRRPITIRDRRLDNIVISGVFRTGPSDNFVSALTSYYPIAASTDASGAVSLSHD